MKLCFNLDRSVFDKCFSETTQQRLQKLVDLDLRVPAAGELTATLLRKIARDCDGIICGWGSLPLDEDLLSSASQLRIALHCGGTIRNIATPAMWKRGVRVTSAANVNGIPVAEYCLGMVLMCFRDVFAQQLRFHAHGRRAWNVPKICSYLGSTVGIIGMGNAGKHLLKLLGNFRMHTLIHSFYPFSSPPGVEHVELDQLMRRSDAVILLAPNLPEYRHMIDGRRLKLMRDGAFFINAARGALVDEGALIQELESGRITACLDITNPEPPVEGSPLYQLPNCILTPHVAGSIGNECLQLGDQVLRELEHYLAGHPFENEITEKMLETIG